MAPTPEFCQNPSDTKGCCLALIQACREECLERHCVMQGLKADCRSCQEVLIAGLYPGAAREIARRIPADLRRSDDFRKACEEAMILGWQQGLRAAADVFVEAYRRLAWFIILKKCDDRLLAEEASQQAFLGMLQCIGKPGWTRRWSLKGLVICTAAREAVRQLKQRNRRREVSLDEESGPDEGPTGSSPPIVIDPEMAECWEAWDQELRASEHGSLTSRIILSIRFVEGQQTGEKYPARQMLDDWRALAEMTDEQLRLLHEHVAGQRKRFPSYGPVPLVASVLNSGTVGLHQIAAVFGAAEGLGVAEARDLLGRMAGMSAGAIHTRFCRASEILRPLKGES